MDVNDLHPPDDYSHRFFIWHEWIQANGPLTTENVFDYFTTSMFYDKQSNNQVLRMQTMHTGMPVANEAEELKRFTGMEFALVHSQPPGMFIIHKRERFSPDEVRPLAAYFVMNNRIYQSPDVYTVLSNRLLTSLYSLQSSLDTLRKHRPDYTPRTGFVWPIIDPLASEELNKKRGAEGGLSNVDDQRNLISAPQGNDKPPSLLDAPKKQQNTMLLLNAMRTTATHSNMSFTSGAFSSAESVLPKISGTGQGMRSSATPAPAASQGATPKGLTNASTPQETYPVRAPAGAGKKKKKRK